MCPFGYPIYQSQNWQSAFLPGIYQGTYIDTQHTEVEKLVENVRNKRVSMKDQREQLELLRELNEEYQARRRQDAQLEARVQSFELAYRMQMDALDAFDVQKEPESIREMYGPGVQARQLLIARRLLEKGVRFVQVWTGREQPWDNHDNIETNIQKLARESDQAIAALLVDLKARGMLDDTLVVWGGEFGRTPTAQGANPKAWGRDHQASGFTMWMAGGGVRPGYVHGATDDFGFRAVKDVVHVHDLHATILHLMGFDHEKFTYRYAGRDFRLTDVHGHVVKELLA
jgi:membrane-anchored protein YejM (alkaline phosphatase superfamily)